VDAVNPVVRRWQQEALEDPDRFWARAADALPWFQRWERVFEPDGASFRWFVGGRTNLAHNALDHHVAHGRAGHAALAYLNERGDRRVLTYAQLLHLVERTAAALRGLGVRRGDRITIYMPVSVEGIALMLATVRVGAIHSVVFAGFGAPALAGRIRASGSRFVFAADVSYRKGNDIPLSPIVEAAVALAPETVERVVTLRRAGGAPHGGGARNLDWEAFLAGGAGHPAHAEWMEANEPAYILATSGTTAKPKLVVHTHGGYQVGIHGLARWCYGMTPDDVWWATSDLGWAVGHSYTVYAPLLVGCTSLAYEGALDHPDPGVLWRTVEEFRVTGLFTSPTAVRLLMRYGRDPAASANVESLTRVFCAGEVLNPAAWEWLQKTVLRDRVPVLDHWWQTETGGPVVGNPYGLQMLPVKAGSAGVALPGVELAVVGPDGSPLPAGEKGVLVIRRPFPSLTATLWGEPERYAADYWERVPGAYFTGDSAHVDADGYVWFAGRADEVINIASHRIGTVEVESALLRHPAVAEAGVTSCPDELRGEAIAAFVVLRHGHAETDALRGELRAVVRQELGGIAVVRDLNFVDSLPKTRSGKIMRRVLKAVVLGRDPGDITTIEDEGSVEDAREAWAALGGRR
jgi:acetyl-CoA synthetase